MCSVLYDSKFWKKERKKVGTAVSYVISLPNILIGTEWKINSNKNFLNFVEAFKKVWSGFFFVVQKVWQDIKNKTAFPFACTATTTIIIIKWKIVSSLQYQIVLHVLYFIIITEKVVLQNSYWLKEMCIQCINIDYANTWIVSFIPAINQEIYLIFCFDLSSLLHYANK